MESNSNGRLPGTGKVRPLSCVIPLSVRKLLNRFRISAVLQTSQDKINNQTKQKEAGSRYNLLSSFTAQLHHAVKKQKNKNPSIKEVSAANEAPSNN